MACLVYAKKYLTISRSACICCSKLLSHTAETRARSDETFFIKRMFFLASVPTVPSIILENKTQSVSFYIMSSFFFKPGFCVRYVNRFFNSKFIYWYFLLIFPLCVALIRKTIPCLFSYPCGNVYPLQRRLLTICEKQ